MLKKLIFTIVIIICQSSVQAFELSQLKLKKNFITDDGLIQSYIWCMTEDSSGRLWIGTKSGLSRWDGQKFTSFNKDDGLVNEGTRSLLTCSNGDIAVGTYSGVSIYRDDSFMNLSKVEKRLDDRIYSIYESDDKTLFFCTKKNGLVIYKDNSFSYLDTSNGLVSNSITAVVKDNFDNLIIGYRYKGIDFYKDGKVTNYNVDNALHSNVIRSIFVDKDESIIITTDKGIINYNRNKFTNIVEKEGLTLLRGQNYHVNTNGTKYFISTKKLYLLENTEFKEIKLDPNLTVALRSLFVSKNGTIFLGTQGKGILVYKKYNTLTINKNKGLVHENIFAIDKDKNGNYYFCSRDGGVAVVADGKVEKFLTAVDGLNYDGVISILCAEDGTVYFGSGSDKLIGMKGKGVSVYKNNEFVKIKALQRLSEKVIHYIIQAKDGAIYFCTNKSIWKYENEKLIDFGSQFSLENEAIRRTFIASDSSYYFGVDDIGLVKIKDNKKKIYSINNNSRDDLIYAINEYSDKSILVGTKSGLFIIKDDRIENITTQDGLSNNTIYSVSIDNNNKIYLATGYGLNILDLGKNPFQIRTLFKDDGFTSNEFNEKAVFKDDEGKLWFGTIAGVTVFDPKADSERLISPNLKITSIYSYGSKLPNNQDVLLDSEDNIIEINYSIIDLDFNKTKYYLYRLVGESDVWEKNSSQTITLEDIKSGEYVLEIKALNYSGGETEPAKIGISVKIPIWRNKWALITLIVIVIVFGYFFFNKFKLVSADSQLSADVVREKLSKRENEVLEFLIRGNSYKEIAEKLFLSPQTVQTHIKNIYKKINVHSKYELIKELSKEKNKKSSNRVK